MLSGKRRYGFIAACTLMVALVFAARPRSATAREWMNDDEIRGYTAAILEREFNVQPGAVTVHDGVVRIQADLADSDREKVKEAIEHLAGVTSVEFVSEQPARTGVEWLPLHAQFKPLLADPRWPHFSASYQYYIDYGLLTNVGSATLGETFPLVRYDMGEYGSVELDVQGGVFAIFNLSGESTDLVNADYLGAIPLTYARGNFSVFTRLQHQSSHLGDEFLLDNPSVARINLSYEELTLLLSYELGDEIRVYGGGSYIFRSEPDLKPWATQLGIEWQSQSIELPLGLKPLAAIDLQDHEETNWDPDFSLRAGVQWGKPLGIGRNLQLLLEFYNGQSPNGQFYKDHITYIGLGADLYF